MGWNNNKLTLNLNFIETVTQADMLCNLNIEICPIQCHTKTSKT
jgi:hypothetical protein